MNDSPGTTMPTTPNMPARLNILIDLTLRNIFFTVLAGALSGGAFGIVVIILSSNPFASQTTGILLSLLIELLLSIFAGIIGGLIGAILGFFAGIANALVTIPVTFLCFYPPSDEEQYDIIIRALTGLTAAATTYLVAPTAIVWIIPSGVSIEQQGINGLILAAIAGISSYRTNSRTTRWYLRQFQSQPDTAQPS